MASYRLDFYNEYFNYDIYFLYENPKNIVFDVKVLWEKVKFLEQ